MNHWDEEEEEQQKIKIPKYKVLAQDIDPKMVEKILECKLHNNLLNKKFIFKIRFYPCLIVSLTRKSALN